MPLSTDGSKLTFDVGGHSGWSCLSSPETQQRQIGVLLRFLVSKLRANALSLSSAGADDLEEDARQALNGTHCCRCTRPLTEAAAKSILAEL